jgi:hypothetical protein
MPARVPLPPSAVPGLIVTNLPLVLSLISSNPIEQIEIYSAVYELYAPGSRLEAISKLMRLVERGMHLSHFLSIKIECEMAVFTHLLRILESTYEYMLQSEAFRILGYLLCYSNDDTPLLRLLIKVAELRKTKDRREEKRKGRSR